MWFNTSQSIQQHCFDARLNESMQTPWGAVVGPGDLYSNRAESAHRVTRAEDVLLPETVPFDRR